MVDLTFQGTPEWYGGKEGILKPLLERARNESLAQYEPYQGERIAQFAPFQEEAFRLASQEANAPYYPQLYEQAQGAIERGLGQNVSGTIAPYLQRGTESPLQNVQAYMNPYQEQVVSNIGRLGSRNLLENILPNVQNRFVGAGQYGSTQQQNLTNRAIRDTQEAVSQAQANALQGGYNTALQTAVGQQEKALQAGQLAGTTAGRDIERQMLGAEALQNLAGTRQGQALRNVGVLGQLGGQQQQQAQNAANVAYQEFQNQRNYPFFQTARLNEIVRGLPVNTQQFGASISPTSPAAPQASPYTQAGGLLAGATGAFGQRFAHGGEVKKLTHHRHYADGGPLNPIQQGANTAIDTAELKAMRDQATNLARPQVDPFWASIARAGFNIAANRQPGVLAKLGQAGGEGLNEYQAQLAQQDQRGLQSAKIMNMIDNTRRLQAERNRSHELEKEKFGQHQKEFGMHHGIQQGHLGLAREKFEHEKGLFEQGLKGATRGQGRGGAGEDFYKKSNQTALEEARKSISTLSTLKSNLNSLKGLAEKLDTGPTKGRIARTSSTLGSLAGVGSAEDIDAFDSLTNSLVLDLGNQLKGSQVALGKLKIIEQSKPQLTKVKGGNIEIINHMKDLTSLAEEKARFINKSLKSNINAIDAEDAFNQYADAKLEYEEKGEEFPNKPEDFLEGIESGREVGLTPSSPAPIDLSSMSDEELQKIAGVS
jgi:hypothetical protein